MMTAKSEFEGLLSDARKASGDAVGQLLGRYRNLLRMLVRAQLRGPIQARVDDSDLVQDALVQAFKGFSQFRGQTEAEMVAWLRSILASQLASLYRHHCAAKRSLAMERKLDLELQRSSVAMQQTLAHSITPSRFLQGEEQLLALAGAIESLPDHYRSVIVLRHIRGEPFRVVAAEMGKSESSVQKLWVRALAKLKAAMKDVS